MAALTSVAPFPHFWVKKPSNKLEINSPRTIANHSRYTDTHNDTAPKYEEILASPCERITHVRRRRGVQNLGLPIHLRVTARRPPPRLILKGPRPAFRLRLTMPQPPFKVRFPANVVALNKAMWAQVAAEEQPAKPPQQATPAPALAILASAEEIAASAQAIVASSYAKAAESAVTPAAKAILASAEQIAASAQVIVASDDAATLVAARATVAAQTMYQPNFVTLCPNALLDTVMKTSISPLSLDHDTDVATCHHINNEDIKMEG